MKPSVGRIVHYQSFGTSGGEYKSECRAAIITGLPEDAPVAVFCDLAVFNPTGLFFKRCPQDEGDKAGGTWHWPERVE